MMADHCPLGRCATPDDVARVVGFLSSQDGAWVNGQVITISGKLESTSFHQIVI
jgi:3-oxoacyl-[acyl-carrier protein] reductase